MPSHRIRTSRPRGAAALPGVATSEDDLRAYLEDAAHHSGGRAVGVASPRSEAELAGLLTAHQRVLVVGAQSSVTGGATPLDDLVISTARLNQITKIERDRVRVQVGVSLASLQEALDAHGLWYPPVPTFSGATVGGVVATNAAGAATFKYGSTRNWVRALRVVLASGDILEIERGEVTVDDHGVFEIETGGGALRVKVPTYGMPDVPKCSAGYYARPGMDGVDLFVGSEGTLGVIVDVTLSVLPRQVGLCLALVPLPDEARGLKLVDALRRASYETWAARDPRGIDVAAIEHVDRPSLDILRRDGADRRNNVSWPPETDMLLLIQLELPTALGAEQAYNEIADALAPDAADTPLVRVCRLLEQHDALDGASIALPGARQRADELLAVREAVPTGVNQRVARAKHNVDRRIEKTAADMIVPFDRFGEMMQIYREGFARRGLDYAIWGHISDGNVHPNVIPRSYDDVRQGRAAILEFGRAIARLGGCPLAEHGVGRNPIKQTLLRQLYGDRGIEEMRRVKRTLDPEGKLARGVLFD
ncbi:MAG: FAD-binding protein [Luteitalea sp.]|nr:FAD-binding protein [Luteitalea sp.]